jgi:hypothetical protein
MLLLCSVINNQKLNTMNSPLLKFTLYVVGIITFFLIGICIDYYFTHIKNNKSKN